MSTALITGGGSGIGRATALGLARDGWGVALAGRRVERLQAVAAEVAELGARAVPVGCDVRDADQVQAAVAVALAELGGLDGLVHSAGVPGSGCLPHEIDEEVYAEIVDTHLGGAFRLVRTAVPAMLARGGGSVVLVSSAAALGAMPGTAAYGAANAGLHALARSVAVAYAEQGLRCSCVCPGLTDTPMTRHLLRDPLRRVQLARSTPLGVATPEQIADVITFLLGARSSHISGAVIPVDGAYSSR